MTSAARKTSAAHPKTRANSQNAEANARANAAMVRYARGDDDAFAELYEILSPRLYRLCLSLCGTNDAEELLQEVFLKVHRARATFIETGGVVAWSFAIARTTHLDRVRYTRRRPETAMDNGLLELRPADGVDPESLATERALSQAFECQLARLSDNLRAAYMSVKVHGMSYADASAVLDISVDAVKQRVHRACDELKAALSLCRDAA
jgi:RNA polymerase sigma-70 factor (ECF subfamily)